jgi:hypothetical protein
VLTIILTSIRGTVRYLRWRKMKEKMSKNLSLNQVHDRVPSNRPVRMPLSSRIDRKVSGQATAASHLSSCAMISLACQGIAVSPIPEVAVYGKRTIWTECGYSE